MTSPRVFIVDDDDAVRDSLKSLFEAYGMSVEDYGSTAEFERRYRASTCECLLLDQYLLGVSGLDFLSSTVPPIRDMPVILMTGRSDPALRRRAEQLGVRAYLEKPIGAGVLMAAVLRAVAAGREGRRGW